MGDKDKRRRPAHDINLPSFGLNLVDGQLTEDMLQKIRCGQGPFSQGFNQPATQDNGMQPRPGPSGIQPSDEIQIIVEDSDNYEVAATEPIVTVEASQIMEEDSKEPKLQVDMKVDYMRFRYTSEKASKKKGPKARAYDDFDVGDEKNVFAEIHLKNYDGVAKIVAYCVNEKGIVHPYNLFGENCHNGVYVLKHKFRNGRTALKMKKVSVTTPKTKEYEANLINQTAYLSEVGITDLKFCKDVPDKQLVYIKVTAILDDLDNQTLSVISTPIQNKKKGEEFKIEDVEPVTAPACGIQTNNVRKNRIMLHVTEKTAFPSEVGVKIRERDSSGIVRWEQDLYGKDKIITIKKCVVKFALPPYRNKDVEDDVEVEMCLYDRTTNIETEPVMIVYKGSDSCHLCSIGPLHKKRKLDEDGYWDNASASFDAKKSSRQTNMFLRSFSKESPGTSAGGCNDEQGVIEDEGERTISLAGNQDNYSSFSSLLEDETEQNPTGSQLVTSVSTHESSYQMPVSQTAMAGTNQGSSLVFSPPQMPQLSVSQSHQQQTEQTNVDLTNTSLNPGRVENNEFLNAIQGAQQSSQASQLSFALINGQLFVVNDDTNDDASAYANQTVQNIGEQQVIVRSVPQQQPSDTDGQSGATITVPSGENVVNRTMSGLGSLQHQSLSEDGSLLQLQQAQQQQQQQTLQPQQAQHQQQQQTLQQQQQTLMFAQMLQLIMQQPTPELQAQMIQTLLNNPAPAGLSVPQQTNQPLGSIASPSEGPSSAEANQYSMDLDDDDLEVDGESNATTSSASKDTNNDSSNVLPSNMIPTCVEEVTVETQNRRSRRHVEKFSNGTF